MLNPKKSRKAKNSKRKNAANQAANAEKTMENEQHAAVIPLAIGAYGRNDDVSDFGIPAEEMIKRCRKAGHTAWAYARVSTKAQDLARQVDYFIRLGIDMGHIIQDKATGTNFERDGFQKLLKLVQEGDVIIFTELDRFGRDFMENVVFAMRITVEKKVGIGFIENQSLNRMGHQSPLHVLISMIMFLTQAYSSHDEHEKILSRTSQGRKIKAKAGAAFGRKPNDITDAFREMEDDILSGRIPQNKAKKALGVN
ncbi:MAG: recombinase family protein, partial [Lachnospiraceae bacterium]|nr:recombinase family protein [Lachnospiraceae bacterium]